MADPQRFFSGASVWSSDVLTYAPVNTRSNDRGQTRRLALTLMVGILCFGGLVAAASGPHPSHLLATLPALRATSAPLTPRAVVRASARSAPFERRIASRNTRARSRSPSSRLAQGATYSSLRASAEHRTFTSARGFGLLGSVLGVVTVLWHRWRPRRPVPGRLRPPPPWAMSATAAADGPNRIFCDLDGVLCDFEKKVVEVCGRPVHQMPVGQLWKTLRFVGGGGAAGFFDQLDWMEDGRQLWEAIEPLNPVIITGLPRGSWAAPQKRRWCRRELGPATEVITCMARDKHRYCAPGAILIDDKLKLKAKWEESGGIFVHHTSTADTLRQLRGLNVTPGMET